MDTLISNGCIWDDNQIVKQPLRSFKIFDVH